MIRRLTARYALLFFIVLFALSAVAYLFVGKIYASELAPALGTPEYAQAYADAMRRVALSIFLFDLPLMVLVSVVSYLLARAAIGPLVDARERERRFAAEAAHELRSPLATIATVAQAARAEATADVQAHLDTIARTALDASAIVGDLLTLAREPAPHALQKEAIDLAMLAQQCAREFQERAAGVGIALDMHLDSAIINGDERRMRELLRNLIDNGIRHARTRLVIRTGQSGKSAILSVHDDGSGIDSSLQERVFERFYRTDTTGDGLGLGLSIGRWIALAHGGDLNVASDGVQHGATFTVRIPLLT